MNEQVQQLQTEVTKLKARLFDAGEAHQQTVQHYQTILADIAKVAGFDVTQQIQIDEVFEKIKQAFAPKEALVEGETIAPKAE
ncbi:hypothetical protein VmeM32_00118 [Vibrio phage vB_VmeM-32]|nr:hypothetical protein VmeM32_00118 [Vibrio phage vB_VmeM-32]